MSGRTRAKTRTKSKARPKKSAATEGIDIGGGVKIFRLWPVRKGEISYAEKEYGVTKAELKRFVKRMDAQYIRDLKAGRIREYHGDIEAMLRD